jgi:hypothetical protein
MDRQGAGLMRRAFIVWVLAACALGCNAEPRWCSIIGRGPNDTLAYPPIARAARVHGVVLGRVVYTSAGRFVRFEPVSGPKMLQSFLANQFASWSFKTNATGDELCQTLVIAEYRLDVPGASDPSAEIYAEAGSGLRAKVQAQTVCLCDPGGTIGSEPPLERVWRTIKQVTHRVFGKHPKPWE